MTAISSHIDNSKANHISQSGFFSMLSMQEQQYLQHNLQYKTLNKGNCIDYMRDHIDYTYVIISGRIKISEIDNKGGEFIKEILKEQDFFGNFLPGMSKCGLEYAEVLSLRLLICKFSSTILEELMASNPKFTMNLSRDVWKRYRKIENRYRGVANLCSARTRLMDFVKEWALSEGTKVGSNVTLSNYLTHQEIASMICTTRVTVTNIFNELRDSGLINYSKGKIEIYNLEEFKA